MFPTWMTIKNWFWHSETIAFARLQVAFGIVWGVLSIVDMSPLLSGKYLTIWLIVSGIITEILRRKNTIKESVVVEQPTTAIGVPAVPVVATFLTSEPPGP